MLVSSFAVCGKKKSRFMKNQKASGLLSKLKIRTPLSNIPSTGDTLFFLRQLFLIKFEIISLK